jgi:hypothetical protein
MESQAVAIGDLGPVDPDTGAEGLTALLLAARLSKEPKAIAPPSPVDFAARPSWASENAHGRTGGYARRRLWRGPSGDQREHGGAV